MAALVDASSPVRFNVLGTPSFTATSASFTAPANSLIVATVQLNGSGDAGAAVFSVTSTPSLTWTERVTRQDNEATLGATSSIWTAPQVTSASRTVTITWTSGAANSPPRRASGKVYVITGADLAGTPVDAVTGANESGSGTNNYTTPSLTPGADGLLIVSDAEWNALGAFEASSDLTQDTAHHAGEMSVCSGYKACLSGVAVTANLNAAGAGTPQHKVTQIIVRAAPPPSGSAVLTGTAVGGITEAQVASGGRTIVITLTGDAFIPS